jgi:hypothetical protein
MLSLSSIFTIGDIILTPIELWSCESCDHYSGNALSACGFLTAPQDRALSHGFHSDLMLVRRDRHFKV